MSLDSFWHFDRSWGHHLHSYDSLGHWEHCAVALQRWFFRERFGFPRSCLLWQKQGTCRTHDFLGGFFINRGPPRAGWFMDPSINGWWGVPPSHWPLSPEGDGSPRYFRPTNWAYLCKPSAPWLPCPPMHKENWTTTCACCRPCWCRCSTPWSCEIDVDDRGFCHHHRFQVYYQHDPSMTAARIRLAGVLPG